MLMRESFVTQFIEWHKQKAYLIRPIEQVRNIVVGQAKTSIRLGNKILLEKGDTVISILRQQHNAFVSVNTFDGTDLREYYSETIRCNETETEYNIVRRLYRDMHTPEIYEVN